MATYSVKYNNSKQKEFLSTLRQEIKNYFEKNNLTPQADSAMWFKVFFWLFAWLGSYLLIVFGNFSPFWLLITAFFHGFTHLFIAFNISHDANHNSISRNLTVNRILSYSLDIIGVNSFLWRVSHNDEHHNFLNIHELDNNINGFGVMRFTTDDPLKPIHRYQHIYAILLYGLSTINYVLFKDINLMRKASIKGIKVPKIEWVKLIAFKLFYYMYVFVIPVLYLNIPFLYVFATFLFTHFFVGLSLAYVFQCGHVNEEMHIPEVKENRVEDAWAVHVLKSTCDFALDNKALTWLTGAINVHIIHHLMPHICHTHYTALAPIVKKVALDYGIVYREKKTFWEAIVSHGNWLKAAGTSEKVAFE